MIDKIIPQIQQPNLISIDPNIHQAKKRDAFSAV